MCAHGSWGTVCNNYWDSLDASVVCGQLGYQSLGECTISTLYTSVTCDIFRCNLILKICIWTGTGPVWLQNLMCTGSEQQLFNCSVMATTYAYCNHDHDSWVLCAGKNACVIFNPHHTISILMCLIIAATPVQNCTDWSIRLVGGSSPSQGRVEVCYNKQWGTICSNNGWYISTLFANVISRQLGYSYFNPTVYNTSYFYFGDGSGGIYFYTPSLLCTGNESSLQDCYHPTVGYHNCNGMSKYAYTLSMTISERFSLNT